MPRSNMDRNNALMLFRFGVRKHIESFANGNLSFSCVGAWINQAKLSGNNIQGDAGEAIFARVLNGDPRIDEMKERLGNNLEIIQDGDYVMMRRRSAKFIPVFCFYGYKVGDLLEENKEHIKHTGWHTLRHDFDLKMYEGFSSSWEIIAPLKEDERPAEITFKPEPFRNRVMAAMAANG